MVDDRSRPAPCDPLGWPARWGPPQRTQGVGTGEATRGRGWGGIPSNCAPARRGLASIALVWYAGSPWGSHPEPRSALPGLLPAGAARRVHRTVPLILDNLLAQLARGSRAATAGRGG